MTRKRTKPTKHSAETLATDTTNQPSGLEISCESLEATLAEPESAESALLAVSESEEILPLKKKKTLKTKVIRDSFSFPEHDYRKISEIKKICLAGGVHAKKGEILRAGLRLLEKLDLNELTQVLEQVDKVKTGRPSASKS